MSNFNGFYPETVDTLIGIRFNNNREWFNDHKDEYKQYVHEPMVMLGKEIYDEMKRFDSTFSGLPKVSRVNRDIRFSKEKLPYKENKWILFRADQTASIEHENPTFFFEISPEWYRYGFGFWPKPKAMAYFRKKVDKNPSEISRHIEWLNSQSQFMLEAERYKKIFPNEHSEELKDWYQCKHLTFIRYEKQLQSLYDSKLLEEIVEGFQKLYPLYQYFMTIGE